MTVRELDRTTVDGPDWDICQSPRLALNQFPLKYGVTTIVESGQLVLQFSCTLGSFPCCLVYEDSK